MFMEQAIEQAKKSIGFTSPNPAVGAILVKNNKVIAAGRTRPAGGNHAEIEAIKNAGSAAAGADLFVLLEPCCHTGRTGPCVEAIIKAGIKKVFIGMKDPNPKVNGGGIKQLKKAGIEIELLPAKSKLAREIRDINQPFIKSIVTGLPYVVMKAAVSLDGKIATATGESKWITGSVARVDARLERSVCDAVLVGAGTVAADNPELAPSGKFKNKKLLRVIIDGDLSTSPASLVYRDKNVLVARTDSAPKKRVKLFTVGGIKTESFGETEVSIPKLLRQLAKNGVQKIFVEGGGGVHGAFADAARKNKRIVDKVIFYIAPKIIGGTRSLSAVGGAGAEKLTNALKISDWSGEKIGDDFRITGFVNKY